MIALFNKTKRVFLCIFTKFSIKQMSAEADTHTLLKLFAVYMHLYVIYADPLDLIR